jgi:hypothetical protein
MAVRRHGGAAATPFGQEEPEASSEPQIDSHKTESLTVASLIANYKTNKDSGYHKVRFGTKSNYDSMMRRIERSFGSEQIRNIDAERLKGVYDSWLTSGRHMAHGLMAMLSVTTTFGATVLKNKDCIRLKFLITQMELKPVISRDRLLTAEQIYAIISRAHAMGFHSVALTQALQYDCKLRQKDVIGEWLPEKEPGESEIKDDGMKWLHGILWSEIDNNLVLHHRASKDGKMIEPDLSQAPNVMREFERIGPLPKDGPMIIFEKSGLPYTGNQFRTTWREVADAAGVPREAKNTGVKSDQ